MKARVKKVGCLWVVSFSGKAWPYRTWREAVERGLQMVGRARAAREGLA